MLFHKTEMIINFIVSSFLHSTLHRMVYCTICITIIYVLYTNKRCYLFQNLQIFNCHFRRKKNNAQLIQKSIITSLYYIMLCAHHCVFRRLFFTFKPQWLTSRLRCRVKSTSCTQWVHRKILKI